MILDIGFSRIPIAYSEERPLIIGILSVKSLLTVRKDGKTIYIKSQLGELIIESPLYITTEACLSKITQAFDESQCHIGIVYQDHEQARKLRDFRDAYIEGKDVSIPEDIRPVGVITFEDLIERALRLDIIDEKDRDYVCKITRHSTVTNLEIRQNL